MKTCLLNNTFDLNTINNEHYWNFVIGKYYQVMNKFIIVTFNFILYEFFKLSK